MLRPKDGGMTAFLLEKFANQHLEFTLVSCFVDEGKLLGGRRLIS